MTSQLSWQPPPVTKCGECRYARVEYRWCYRNRLPSGDLYEQNKDGITESCPAWQQQNKDSK